jgi:hypothetical protein
MNKLGESMAFYQLSEPLRHVQYFNALENAMSEEFHRETFCEYLALCGYKAQYLTADELKDMKQIKPTKMTQEEQEEEWTKIATCYVKTWKVKGVEHIEHIPHNIESINKIRALEQSNAATRSQSLEREKFFFLKVADLIGLVQECRARVFWSVWMSPRGRQILDNIRSEVVGYSTHLQKEKSADIAQGLAEVYKTTAEKRRTLRGLAAAMGMKNTYEGGQVVTREQMMEGAKYIGAHIGSFVNGFNLEADKLAKITNPKASFANVFHQIQGLFLELTGLQFKSSCIDPHTKTATEYTTRIFLGLELEQKEQEEKEQEQHEKKSVSALYPSNQPKKIRLNKL